MLAYSITNSILLWCLKSSDLTKTLLDNLLRIRCTWGKCYETYKLLDYLGAPLGSSSMGRRCSPGLGNDLDNFFPAGPVMGGDHAKDWFLERLNNNSKSRYMLFLVGGHGNGKSQVGRAIIEDSNISESHNGHSRDTNKDYRSICTNKMAGLKSLTTLLHLVKTTMNSQRPKIYPKSS